MHSGGILFCPLSGTHGTELRNTGGVRRPVGSLNSAGSKVMKVTITLPDRSDLHVDERYAREALVATLYSNGKVSGREAREILGMTRRTFEEMLPRYGFSILVDTKENIETELNA